MDNANLTHFKIKIYRIIRNTDLDVARMIKKLK